MDIAALPGHVPLVIATRGDAVESVYYGSIAVADASGRYLGGVGDGGFPMFTRSTLKPFQALPLMLIDGPGRLGFSGQQVALLCASHSGEPRHVVAVADMLARCGASEAQLQCGCHVPAFYAATGKPAPADLMPSPLQHNCSGKHAGFLAWCRLQGAPMENYLDPLHPLQLEIRRHLAALLEGDEHAMPLGIDGCSAPNYALSLTQLAMAYARLAQGGQGGPYADVLSRLCAAMTAYPEMVSGEARHDLHLMQAGQGDWVAKGGADGMQALGVRSRGLGIAIKIADGNPRAVLSAVSAVIEQLGLWPAQDEHLRAWRQGELFNYRGLRTGRLEAVFSL